MDRGHLSRVSRFRLSWVFLSCLMPSVLAQKTYTWQELREKFESSNPTLKAAQDNVAESRAQEITAYLRPNPDLNFGIDQLEPFVTNPYYRPFSQALPSGSIDYLHERKHKRELRLEAAKQGTLIAQSQLEDQRRTLLFSLRNAYVQLLQAKAIFAQAKENLAQYDKVIDVNRDRQKAGDIAQVDFDRIELQRVQFESDLQTADVNARTA
jgi:cobalt-zinc-cadmium efflux system outer membrane protein